jgi:REP element-mobilizing transposase RayT
VHVTLRSRLAPLRSQLLFPSVRLALMRAARRDPRRFRVVHFSVQRDHVHLIVEAADKQALSSGMRSVAIRIARYVNDLLARGGRLWARRWHGRALKSPREVRNAIVYVVANFRKHARAALRSGLDPYSSAPCFDGFREWSPASGTPPPFALDAALGMTWWQKDEAEAPRRGLSQTAAAAHAAGELVAASFPDRSSSRARSRVGARSDPPSPARPGIPFASSCTWLGRVGWRRHGLIGIAELPAHEWPRSPS